MRKKVGIALSAGSARGLSHIGILKVLEKNKIDIDYITGTSMGALIGALYAYGYSAKEIEKIALEIHLEDLVDFIFPRYGLVSGHKVEHKLRELLRDANFSDLKIPLRVVAADLTTKKEIIFSKGSVVDAVRASISLPVFFEPVRVHNHLIVDGGVLNPIPVDQLKAMGAKYIIATDLTTKPTTEMMFLKKGDDFSDGMKERFVKDEIKIMKKVINDPTTTLISKPIDKVISFFVTPSRLMHYIQKKRTPPIVKVMTQSMNLAINKLAIESLKNKDIDVIIKPDINIGMMDFNRVEYAIKQGEKAANKVIKEIKRDIRSSS